MLSTKKDGRKLDCFLGLIMLASSSFFSCESIITGQCATKHS